MGWGSWSGINNVKFFMTKKAKLFLVQVNLCQKHSFLNQLTHNMMTDCSLIYNFSTRQIQNMLWTKHFLNAKTKTIFVHNMFWTFNFLLLKSGINKQSVDILWVNWFKNECFWHRFTYKCCIQHVRKGNFVSNSPTDMMR